MRQEGDQTSEHQSIYMYMYMYMSIQEGEGEGEHRLTLVDSRKCRTTSASDIFGFFSLF